MPVERSVVKLPALITTDLHLTANPRDAYRWDLFPWLRKECEKNGVQTLCILGDVTDSKDFHPAVLVNRIVREINACRAVVPRVVVLQGNHDFQTKGNPALGFLSVLGGITFVDKPLDTSEEGESTLWLPYTKTAMEDWKNIDFSHYRYVMIHQTVDGSVASNGERMIGDKFPDMSAAWKIYAGDIHVSQIINGVEYVGSPYHVHFGDNFKPRCVLIDSFGKPHDLRFRTLSRRTIECLPGEFYVDGLPTLELRSGDQVKVRIHLSAVELPDWLKHRRQAAAALKEAGVEVYGIELIAPKSRRRMKDDKTPVAAQSDADIILSFVEREELGGDAADIALDLLK